MLFIISNTTNLFLKLKFPCFSGHDLTTSVLSTSPSATAPPVITTSANSRNGPCKYATTATLEPSPSNGPPLGPPADQYVHFGLGPPAGPHHQYLQPPGPPPSWNRFSEQFSQRVGCLPSGAARDHHSLTGNDHPLLSDLDKPTGQLPHQSSLDMYRNNYGAPEFHHTNRRVPSHQSAPFLESTTEPGFGHCSPAKTFASTGLLGMQSCPVFGHVVTSQEQGMFAPDQSGSCAYNPGHTIGHFLQPK